MPNISEQRLAELEDFEAILSALEAGGVNNWEWYDESLKPYREAKEKEEKLDDLVEEICEALASEVDEPAGYGCGYGFREGGLLSARRILERFITEQQKENK
jgi:hypothetical protein